MKSETRKLGGGGDNARLDKMQAPDPSKRSRYDGRAFNTASNKELRKAYTTGEYSTERWRGGKEYGTKSWSGGKEASGYGAANSEYTKHSDMGKNESQGYAGKEFRTEGYSGASKEWNGRDQKYATSNNRDIPAQQEKFRQPEIMSRDEYSRKTIQETRSMLGRD